MRIYKRLVLWDQDHRILELKAPERDELKDHSDGSYWRILGSLLSISAARDVRDELGSFVSLCNSSRGGGRQAWQ